MSTEVARVALVTGGTSGIGMAAAKGLVAAGMHVVLLGRDSPRSRAARKTLAAGSPGSVIDWIEADLRSQASIRAAAEEFNSRFERLNVLICAAGVFHKTRSETVDGIESTFAVNYLSHFLLSNLLAPALSRGAPSRVVFIASRYGKNPIDFEDLMVTKRKFTIMNSVPATKLAEILLAQELAERWQSEGVVVNAIHPGLVAHTHLLEEVGGFWQWMTNTFGHSPEKGADTAVWLATAPEASGLTGKFFANRRTLSTPGQGSDPAVRARLWTESLRLTHLEPAGPPAGQG